MITIVVLKILFGNTLNHYCFVELSIPLTVRYLIQHIKQIDIINIIMSFRLILATLANLQEINRQRGLYE